MKAYKYQSGATLIEIAIAVLILSASLLAMATLQTRSLQYNQSAFMRSQANIHAYDIIDRIRINRGLNGSNIGAYTADYDVAPTGNALAVGDVADWRANIQRTLPDGKGKIQCAASTRICTITVRWSEKQLFNEATPGSNPEAATEFVYVGGI